MSCYSFPEKLSVCNGINKKLQRTCVAFLLLALSPFLPYAHAEEKSELEIKYFEITKGRLAFTYYKDPATKEKESDIYVLDFKALTVKPLVTGPGLDEYPTWSPDGQSLLFYSDTGGDRDIYSIRANGSSRSRLTSTKGADEDPDWSPDGTKIVFQSMRDGGGASLYTMNSDGSGQQRLEITKKKESSANIVPRWSPRGGEILYSSNEYWPGWDILLYDLKDKKNTVLTNGNQSFFRGSWHPSGSSFVFSYGSGDSIDLWQYAKGAVGLAPLISRPGREYDGTWNEDGTKLFFAGEETPGKGDFQIFVWDSEKNTVDLVLAAPGSVRYLSWTSLPTVESLEKAVTGTSGQEQGN